MSTNTSQSLLYEKYDVPAPRYTSYPTVPYWEGGPTREQWFASLRQSLGAKQHRWSMYVHIPYCETLCSFCGCNTIITKSHQKERPYIDLLHQEFKIYLQNINELRQCPLVELHLGGGTPTFLSAQNLDFLLTVLLESVKKDQYWLGSVEVNPCHTQKNQLEVLRRHGFRRISLGVQDFNQEVQQLINRIQTYQQTQDVTQCARELGYNSVNFDLIYGLPCQSLDRMKITIEKTLSLRPDRIALYSLALIPWIKPSQRLFKIEDLPKTQEKRKLYEYSRQALLEAGYIEIGMDHFALPSDDLSLAQSEKKLHRNFMGYTPIHTQTLLGLGLSAISETPDYFHQNQKKLSDYSQKIHAQELPSLRGHSLTKEDKEYRQLILEFMTRDQVHLTSNDSLAKAKKYLQEMLADGLVDFSGNILKITPKGKPFLRNACMALDQRLQRQHPEQQVFSKAI